MATPSATFVPFELFGTTYQQTSDLLSAFHLWTESGEETENAEAKKTRKLINSSTKAGSPQRQFWDEAYQSVDAWCKEVASEPGEPVSIGLLPFTLLVMDKNRKPLEQVMNQWWHANGSASKETFPIPDSSSFSKDVLSRVDPEGSDTRSSRRTSRSQSERRSRSRSEQARPASEDPFVAASTPNPRSTLPPAEDTGVRTPSLISRRSLSHMGSHRESVDPYPFLGDLDPRLGRSTSALRRKTTRTVSPGPSKRPRVSPSLLFHGEANEPVSEPEDSDLEAEQAAFIRKTKAEIASLQSEEDSRIPHELVPTFKEIRLSRSSQNDDLMKLRAQAAASHRIPYKARLAIVRYKFVDLREIYGFDNSATITATWATNAEGTLVSTQSAPKKEIPSALAWIDTWETYTRMVVERFPALRRDHEDYGAWMRHQNCHVHPARWSSYSALDVHIRTNLGTSHFPVTLMGCVADASIILRFINNDPLSSQSDAAFSRATRARPFDQRNEICHRFQDGRCPGGLDCRGRLHQCENCGGDHAGQDCDGDKTATEERLSNRYRRYENGPIRPIGGGVVARRPAAGRPSGAAQ
ncbi:hypothetical protein JCM11491_001094 [Sporobolomyces phaffii]